MLERFFIVHVWDYKNKIHVISKMFEEELFSIAFHPSAMHALVSTDDKIYLLNAFYDEIDNMVQPITSRKSKEIKFSNMEHLFALIVELGLKLIPSFICNYLWDLLLPVYNKKIFR